MRVENNLLNFKNMKIIQDTDYFSFSLDSVLLANFVTINKSDNKIIDFCTGNAPIPLLLNQRINKKIIGVELQKEIYDMAIESVNINNLQDEILILNKDIKDLYNMYESDYFDVITCNPPYFKTSEKSLINKNDIKSIARHEIKINLSDIFKISKKLLKNNGRIALVHRPERLVEIIIEMRNNNIEPKKIQFVYPKKAKESNIILIEGTKNGLPGINVLPPLYVHDEEGNYLKEIKNMFE